MTTLQSAIQLTNLGNILFSQNKLSKAIKNYQKAIKTDPKYPDAYHNLAITLKELKNHDLAIKALKTGLDYIPQHPNLISALVDTLRHACDWHQLKTYQPQLDHITKQQISSGEKTAINPFESLYQNTNKSLQKSIAQSWATHTLQQSLNSSPFKRGRSGGGHSQKQDKTRLAYLSSDFRDHATVHLTKQLYRLHNRSQFKVYCYSNGRNDKSPQRRHIQETCDQFTNIYQFSPLNAAQKINQDKIDILIDMNIYTQSNTLEIPSFRPAPIQISYLGYPGTSGSKAIDYLITDKVITSPNQTRYYTEKLIFMPHTYQVTDNKQETSNSSPFIRGRLGGGYQQEHFIFTSFNLPYKIDPIMFNTWMNILKSVPNSILWLLKTNSNAIQNLKKAAQIRSINPNRLVFKPILARSKHLNRIQPAHLALDTRICNGHTTTDALYAGLPVLTLQGKHFASRVSSSLLTAIGLPELITHSLKEYEALAINLATNPKMLSTLRSKLLANKQSYPLFDTPQYVKHLEQAYLKIWDRYQNSQKPAHIEIQPDS